MHKTGLEVQGTAKIWGKVGDRVFAILSDNDAKIVNTMQRLEELLKRLNDALTEENQKSITRILGNVARSSDRLESLAFNAEAMLKEGKQSFESMNKILSEKNQKNVSDILATSRRGATASSDRQRRRAVHRRSPCYRQTLGRLAGADRSAFHQGGSRGRPAVNAARLFKPGRVHDGELNKLAVDGRELLNAITRTDGTVQRLLADPSLYTNLNASACMVNQMLPRLDRVLRDVEIFADKIARHPEALGLGGVIRPASGLKGPQTTVPYQGP